MIDACLRNVIRLSKTMLVVLVGNDDGIDAGCLVSCWVHHDAQVAQNRSRHT